jgi:predicted nicotinamide N-methyase
MADTDEPFTYSFEGSELSSLVVDENHDEIGCRVWDLSTLFCKFFERHSDLVRQKWQGKTVLELGAGTGITSMVLARLLSAAPGSTAAKIIATDTPPVVKHMQSVFETNKIDVKEGPKATVLVWNNKEHIDAVLESFGRPDVILACDMAAPVKFVADFLATVRVMMPPSSAPAAASGEAGASSRASVPANVGTERNLASLLSPPCIVIASQRHRDFTSPMLEGLRDIYGEGKMTELAPQADYLHQSYLSEERHCVHVIHPCSVDS